MNCFFSLLHNKFYLSKNNYPYYSLKKINHILNKKSKCPFKVKISLLRV